MANTVRLVDGATEVILRPEFPSGTDAIFTQKVDLGFPEAREVMQENPDTDGILDFTRLHGKRTITINCKVTGNMSVDKYVMAERIKTMCQARSRPYLFVQRNGWEGERRISLRSTAYSCIWVQVTAAYIELALTFIAPAGVFDAVTAVSSLTIRPAGGPGSFTLAPGGTPMGGSAAAAAATAFVLTPGTGSAGSTAFTLTSGTGSNMAMAINSGSAVTYPILNIFGQCVNPIVRNRTTGEAMSLAGYTVPTGSLAVIDMAARTANLISTGVPISLYSKIDWSISRWWSMDGDTIVEFDTSSSDTSSYLTVTYTPKNV